VPLVELDTLLARIVAMPSRVCACMVSASGEKRFTMSAATAPRRSRVACRNRDVSPAATKTNNDPIQSPAASSCLQRMRALTASMVTGRLLQCALVAALLLLPLRLPRAVS
jgi:hypothetical protein